MCTPESAHHAVEAIGLIFQERELLAKHGVDWRLYQNYEGGSTFGCFNSIFLERRCLKQYPAVGTTN
jgi:hypothetical protein